MMRIARFWCFSLSFAACLVATVAGAQASARKPIVERLDQLPNRTYAGPGEGDRSAKDEGWLALLENLRKDLISDLTTYDIRSGGVQWQLHSVLFNIAVFTGRYDEALAHIDGIAGASSKESVKAYQAILPRAIVAAERPGPQRG